MSFIINPFVFAVPGSPSGLEVVWIAGAEHEGAMTNNKFTVPTGGSIASGVTDAHGRVYQVTAGGVPNVSLPSTETNISVLMRFRPTIDATGNLIVFHNAAAAASQVRVRLVDDGAFEVMLGSGSTSIEKSATGLWVIDTWYWILFQSFVDNSGSYIAKLWDDSGSLLEDVSGSADTQSSATAGVDRIDFGNTANDPYFDNIFIDISGTLQSRCRVETLYPNAAGDAADWPRGGTDTGANYTQVNEAVQNADSYIQSSAADQYDFYNIEARSITGTPKAVQVNVLGNRVTGAANPVQFKIALRIGGVTYEDSVTQEYSSTATVLWKGAVWNNNPATGNAWTDAEINSLQIGVRNIAANVRIHQICAEVLVQL